MGIGVSLTGYYLMTRKPVEKVLTHVDAFKEFNLILNKIKYAGSGAQLGSIDERIFNFSYKYEKVEKDLISDMAHQMSESWRKKHFQLKNQEPQKV